MFLELIKPVRLKIHDTITAVSEVFDPRGKMHPNASCLHQLGRQAEASSLF